MGKMAAIIECSEATGVRLEDPPVLPSITTTTTSNVVFCHMIIVSTIGIVHCIQ